MPSTFLTSAIVGANLQEKTTEKKFALGTPGAGNQNDTWVYVQADVAVSAAQAPVMNTTTFHLTAATGGAYTADTAFAINEYGWVRKTTSPL